MATLNVHQPSLNLRPFGFNVIGHISANVGVGVVARNVIRLVLARGYPVTSFDVDPGRGRARHDTTYDALAVQAFDDLPYGISLIVLSITALPDILIDRRIELRSDVLNAGFFWWELPVIPDVWVKSLEQFDVLVAGSQFLHSTFERCVSGIPAIHALQPMQDFGETLPNREKFGIPGDKTAFVCILEPTSDPIRKNPYAAIEAFRHAFTPGDPAHLVIKLNNARAARDSTQLDRLREAIVTLGSRVTLIDSFMPHRDVMELFASCDVFIGLHRAEGLGLGLMEAMALGKPVVATGWSGNMTFMNHTNSCLVHYRLVPVAGSVGAYSPGFLKEEVQWAEPDIEDAAAWLSALAAEPALRETIGRKAAADIGRYRADAERGVFIDELCVLWERARIRPLRPRLEAKDMVKVLAEARFDNQASAMDRVRRRSRDLLDRHLSWRFRAR